MSFPRSFSAFALAATLLVPLAASAQSVAPPPAPQAPAAGAPAHAHHAGMRQALKNLNLSDDQRKQIAGIMKQTRQANQNADPQTRRANMKQMRAQINGVLTPDQQTQLRVTLRNMHRANAAAPSPN